MASKDRNKDLKCVSGQGTYFVGASCSSISPFMNVAIFPAAALVSSAVLEIVSLFSSSSRTWTEFWFSDLVVAAFDGADSITSMEGIFRAEYEIREGDREGGSMNLRDRGGWLKATQVVTPTRDLRCGWLSFGLFDAVKQVYSQNIGKTKTLRGGKERVEEVEEEGSLLGEAGIFSHSKRKSAGNFWWANPDRVRLSIIPHQAGLGLVYIFRLTADVPFQKLPRAGGLRIQKPVVFA